MSKQPISNFQLLLSIFFLVSCASSAPAPAQPVRIYSTSAAQPYLADLYACADQLSLALITDPQNPEILLRIGEPPQTSLPMYQIGGEEIVVFVNEQNPIQSLNLIEAQQLFALGNPAVQVWVFSAGEDVQQAFEQLALKGRRVVSSAKVAATAQQMSFEVAVDSSAVGVLPKTWLGENARVVFSAGIVPVLAVTQPQPSDAVTRLVACLQ